MKHLKTYENINALIPDEYANFIKWLTISTSPESDFAQYGENRKRKFAYNINNDKWLDLSDYATYHTLNDLFLIYKSEKYNL